MLILIITFKMFWHTAYRYINKALYAPSCAQMEDFKEMVWFIESSSPESIMTNQDKLERQFHARDY